MPRSRWHRDAHVGGGLGVGEVIAGDVAGDHHYPSRDRVTGWLNAAGLQIIDDYFHQEDGWATATSCSRAQAVAHQVRPFGLAPGEAGVMAWQGPGGAAWKAPDGLPR